MSDVKTRFLTGAALLATRRIPKGTLTDYSRIKEPIPGEEDGPTLAPGMGEPTIIPGALRF